MGDFLKLLEKPNYAAYQTRSELVAVSNCRGVGARYLFSLLQR